MALKKYDTLFENYEIIKFQEIVEQSLEDFKSINEFQYFIENTIGDLIPHSKFFVSIEKLVFDHVCTNKLLIIDKKMGCIEDAKFSTGIHQHRIIKTWLSRQKPLAIDAREYEKYSPYIEKNSECKLDVDNLIVHGQIDISGRMATIFGFANLSSINRRCKLLVEAVTPYIQRAFVSTIASTGFAKKHFDLSPKEYEVLKWLACGRTNKEIGKILDKSDMTVRNQVHSILEKLGAGNRLEIIIRAEEAGLLSKWSTSFL